MISKKQGTSTGEVPIIWKFHATVDVGCLSERQRSYASRSSITRMSHNQDEAYRAVDDEGCSNLKEQYVDVVQPLIQWLYASGPAAGFDLWEWNMCMKHLGDPAVHWGVGTLMERFEKAAPPGDFDELDWVAFMHAIQRAVRQLQREYISSLSAGGGTSCISESNEVHCKSLYSAPNVTEVFRYGWYRGLANDESPEQAQP
ncbi:hypothetical protein L208DRAFT_1380926 [Tricholoma matsutake]|nr:hypothetical protein L208DRAFT_1380926 [Tricholoma matsutake 945]